MTKIVVIDGKSVFYRGFYAMKNLSLKDGTPTGGVFGFASILLTAIDKIKPDNIYVAWDKAGTSVSKRKAIFADYKAGRVKPPEDFYAQIPVLRELLDSFNIPFYEFDDYEADDIIGTLAVKSQKAGVEAFLISSDLDMLQVIGPKTHFYALKTGFTNIEEYDEDNFEEKFGLKLSQFLDYKALRGDTSDNIPGVPGVGPKTASDLLNAYGDIEGIYKNLENIKPKLAQKLSENEQMVEMSKQLAQILLDAPLELDLSKGKLAEINIQNALNELEKLEFNSLRSRMIKIFNYSVAKSGNQSDLFSVKPENNEIKFEQINDLSCLTSDKKEIIIDFDEQYFYLRNSDANYKISRNDFAKNLNYLSDYLLVVRDIKNFLNEIDHKKSDSLAELPVKFDSIYDINQAEFLIDPLRREKVVDLVKISDVESLNEIFIKQKHVFANDNKLKLIAKNFDFKLASVLYLIENRGVKIDKEFFKQFSKKISQQEADITKQIHDLAGEEFNVNSPSQLATVLFEKLNLPTKGIKKGKTGYSTGKKELDKLMQLHPIVPLISDLREVTKLRTTYVDNLPDLTDTNSRLHSTFNQDVTSTGRLSSTNPNLQNIPIKTDLGRELREGFIAEEGKVLVSADYAQFELRLAAFMSKDTDMLETFNQNRDIHTDTAADIYQKPAEEITKYERTIAKTVNFSVLYGAGPRNLTQTVKGLSYAEAKELIDKYFEARKPLKDLMDNILIQAEENGYVETYFGRKRPTPDIKSSNFIIREAAKRASANMPIQGTGADLMKLSMIKLEQLLAEQFPTAKQILQIHDSIMVECDEKDAEAVAKLMHDTMENICPEINVNLGVETKIGKTWQSL